MPLSPSNLKAYKGPAILAVAAVTLIGALAIPKATERREIEPASFDIKSSWTAQVKRTEVPVGRDISVGETLLVLTDPALEAEISRLEDELKIAMLGTKEAVADAESMMGMIGTLPRVVWETVKEPAISGSIKAPAPVAKAESPNTAPLIKEIQGLTVNLDRAQASFDAKDAELSEATSVMASADTDLRAAQTSQSTAAMLQERARKLYDMGAIPKKKLDAAVVEYEESSQAVTEAKAKVEAAQERQTSLEKELADLKSELDKLQSKMTELKSKLAAVKAKPVLTHKAPEQKPVTTVKRVRKVVYGTVAPQESLAPVEVNLVESVTPEEEKTIEALRAKLVALKLKREDLKIKAMQPGKVIWIAETGSKVEPGAKLITIQPHS